MAVDTKKRKNKLNKRKRSNGNLPYTTYWTICQETLGILPLRLPSLHQASEGVRSMLLQGTLPAGEPGVLRPGNGILNATSCRSHVQLWMRVDYGTTVNQTTVGHVSSSTPLASRPRYPHDPSRGPQLERMTDWLLSTGMTHGGWFTLCIA